MNRIHTFQLVLCFFLFAGTALGSSVGTDFVPAVNGAVYTQVLQPDGKIIIGGQFTTVSGSTASNIARINPDGTVDRTFDAVADDLVYTITLQADGKLIVGGKFTSINQQPRGYIVRLNTDGTTDPSFETYAGTWVYTCVVQGNNQVVIGGEFTALNGFPHKHIARLNADGTVDSSFYAESTITDGFVRSLTLQSGGKFIVGGLLTTYYGKTVYLLRLNTDGGLDVGFSGDVSDLVYATAIAPDQKILVAGQFSEVSGQKRGNFARLNADGTLDMDFAPSFDAFTNAIAVAPNGQIVVGGTFAHVNGFPRSYLARLNGDGSLDGFFSTKPNGSIGALSFQSDGKLLVGGFFDSVNGATTGALVRLNPDLDPNDIPIVTLTVLRSTSTVGNGQAAQIQLNLSTSSTSELRIPYTAQGTAVPDRDYAKLNGTAKVKAGHTTKTINIASRGDLGGTGKKTVKVTLGTGVGYFLGEPVKAKIKLLPAP